MRVDDSRSSLIHQLVWWPIRSTRHYRSTTVPSLSSPSRAERHLIVAVATAAMGLRVVIRVEVCVGAARATAMQVHAGAAREVHGQVVAVDHRDVVVVVGTVGVADGELGQRQGRLPRQGAGEGPATVARLAVPTAAAVEGAAGAAPDPAGLGARGHVDGPRLPRVQLRATAHRGRRWPHCVGAVVLDGEGGRAGATDHGNEEEKDRRGGPGRHWYWSSVRIILLQVSSIGWKR